MCTLSPFHSETRATASSALDMLTLDHRVGGDRGRDHPPEHLDVDTAARLDIDGQIRIGQVARGRKPVPATPQPADHLAFPVHTLPPVNHPVVLPPHHHHAH